MKKLFGILTTILLILILGLLQFSRSAGDIFVEKAQAEVTEEESESASTSSIFAQESGQKIEVDENIHLSNEFKIEIPSIGLSKEIETNVDPREKEIYGPVIEQKVAHGMFTKLPDETAAKDSGNVYLFAHRDGDSPFFSRLGELEVGETIYVYYGGKKYIYGVSEYFIVDPKDTSVYTGDSPSPTLTLQTCNNGIKERLIVRADLISVV